jgi:type III secretion system chaperone SycN
MDWVSHTVSAFGQSVGIPELTLDNDGYAMFVLEPGGMLCLQDLAVAGGDDMRVMLSRPLPTPAAACVRQALRMADFRAGSPWVMQLGLRDGDLVVTVRMPRHSFMLSALEEALEALFEFHGRVSQAH